MLETTFPSLFLGVEFYGLATVNLGGRSFNSVSACLWIWFGEAIEGGPEVSLEGPRELELVNRNASPPHRPPWKSPKTLELDPTRLVPSVRESISVELESYASCVSGPSNVEVEYAVDPGCSSNISVQSERVSHT